MQTAAQSLENQAFISRKPANPAVTVYALGNNKNTLIHDVTLRRDASTLIDDW